MATFEEKTLAYLDGSLPAEGREELLAGMSGNSASAARHRALFEEHIRMADLMTLAQKPISAPLSLQRELASKVPVLAMKLPYLASDRKNNDPVAAGWFGQVRSSYIGAILFVALAIIAGCVWFAVNQRDAVQSGDTSAANSASNSNASVQSGGMSGSLSQNSAQNISSQNSNGTGLSGSSAGSNRVEVSHPHRAGGAASNVAGNDPNSQKIPSAVSLAYTNSSGDQSQDRQVQDENPASKLADQNSPNEPEQQILPAKIQSSSPAVMIGSASTMHSLSGLDERAENDGPVRVFAAEEYRFIRLNPQPALSDFTRSNGLQTNALGFESPEFGIDYALDPWISIGLRGGDARFVQEQAVTTQNNSTPGYPLSREVRETILLDPFAAWFGPAITYSLSASQSASFTGTLAVADALVTALAGAISPVVRGEFAFLYDLSNTFALRFAASYEADWTPSATPISVIPTNSTSGVVVGSNTATHESQVFGVSLGISFHP